ncbi:MAG: HD-GYP domain-containing protein, partial [Synergistaceae bacterium]|nr:HD-GYP domain-containing protein [Synergistaceae bacterium]
PALDDHVLGVAIYRDASRKKEEETELIMSLEREGIISSISARLLEKGARGVPGAMGEMAAFLGVNRGALVEMDCDDVPTGEIILTDGEISEGTSPLEFASLPASALCGFAGRPWEKGPVEIGSSGRPEERHEALILEAVGLQGDHVHAQPVYSGTEGNAFLLLQKGREPISYADSALITKFCALSGSVLLRDIRMQMIKETNRLLEGASRDIVEILARALSMKDPFTAGHQINVANLAKAMAEKGGYDESFTERVYYSGLVHDLGKIAIPSSILSKPGRLTEVEFEIIKGHVRLGWEILSSVELPWPLAEIILQHHERLDGSGYPGLLEGSSIIKEARFLAVADVVEAMISHRPYRAGLSIKEALSEIKRFRGIRFDPEAVDLCIAVIEEGFVMSDPSYLPYP